MTFPLSEKLQSPLATFYLGGEDVPVVVHSGVIADLSNLLQALVTRSLGFGPQTTIRIPDVSHEDFLRLSEFAYSAEYTAPTYEICEDDDRSETVNGDGDGSDDKKNEGQGDQKEESDAILKIPSIMPTLLVHARMFRLAAKYFIESLGEYALLGIHHTCVDLLEHGTENPGAVVELIRIAYDDPTVMQGTTPSGGNMMRLQSYVVFIAATMANGNAFDESKEFKELLEKGGAFVVSFWQCSRTLDDVRKKAGF